MGGGARPGAVVSFIRSAALSGARQLVTALRTIPQVKLSVPFVEVCVMRIHFDCVM